VLVLAVGGVVTGVLYSQERFTMPAVVSVVWNLVIIGFITLGHGRLGVYAIAWGTLAGTGVELLLLMAAARAAGVGLSLHLDLRDPLLRKVLLLMVPVTITLGVLNFNALVDTFFAQFVNNHAAAQIYYSFRLYQLPQGIFAVTIGTILFPSLSRFAASEESDRFRETLSMGVRQMFFVSLPFIAWFALLPRPLVQLVYQRGQFGGSATHHVAAALAGFSAGLAFANANIMFNRGFQSMKRPWLPLYAALVNLALNAVLDWVLLGPLGVAGITLSTSIVSAFNFAVLVWLMRRQVGRVDGRRIARALAGALVCAAVLAGVSYGVWRGLEHVATHGFLLLAVCLVATVAAGAVAYVGLAKALRLEELTLVWRALRRRGVEAPGAAGS
jgi:putative peptidoglycan lipid II flippase